MIKDKHNFLQNLTVDDGPWFSHRALLFLALEETRKNSNPVLELGIGDGSTPHLHRYCKAEKRTLVSLDNNAEQVARFSHFTTAKHTLRCVPDWADSRITDSQWSVALVDHAPPAQRGVDVALLSDRAAIIVIHDTEPQAKGYGLDAIWHLFRYRADINLLDIGTSAVSNTIDLRAWDGAVFEGRTVTAR